MTLKKHPSDAREQETIVKIRNVNFNVKVTGEGFPFIWAHGLFSSIESEEALNWFNWQNLPPQIKLIRYDARGHGKSQPSYKAKDYRWENLGRDMLAIADSMGVKNL